MAFNTQICTTKEQSERLLALGLKTETADMRTLVIDGCEVAHFEGDISCANGYSVNGVDIPTDKVKYVPAWSLHRLIALLSGCSKYANWALDEVTYENMIGMIGTNISRGRINQKYSEE